MISDLINSYAWDTAIVFIEKCGNNSNYSNYKRPYSGLTTAGYSGTSGNDKQCNIFDMGGNVFEWSTETDHGSFKGQTMRGGGIIGGLVSARMWPHWRQDETEYLRDNIGFRPILYFMLYD